MSLATNKQKGLQNKQGFTLVETLFYILILVLVVGVLVGALLSFTRSYRDIHLARETESGAVVSLERLTREIRGASGINLADSSLGTSPGVLALNSLDDSGSLVTLRFYLVDARLYIEEDDVQIGPLTPVGVEVTNLIFSRIITAESEAVKIEMEIEDKKFYSTVVLRSFYTQ